MNFFLWLGDLNATPWSAHFKRLLRNAKLRNASRGHGIHRTWPVGMWLMRIPIDHALHSVDVAIADFYVGDEVGSDHLPIVVDVIVALRPGST